MSFTLVLSIVSVVLAAYAVAMNANHHGGR
jgi:hypothetical protein